MIVKLFDGTEYIVDQKRADEIIKVMPEKDNMVRLGGGVVRVSAIASIMPGGYTQPDLPKPVDSNRRIKSDNRSEEEQFKAARKASDVARKMLRKRGLLKTIS